jgi:NADH-quinone oxidoreductase subunit C
VASSPGRLQATEVTERLRARFGEDLLETSEAGDQAWVRIAPARHRDLIQTLRDDAEFGCDFIDFVAGVDRQEEGFDVVVQLYSTSRRHQIRVKLACDREQPTAPTISDLYPGANWHERETWELFGIEFEGHPQLVKLLLPEEFEGHPLRKDFPLTTRLAKPWPGAEEGEGTPEDEE